MSDPAPSSTAIDSDYVGWHVTKVYTRAEVSPSPLSYQVTYYGNPNNPSDASHPDFAFRYIIKEITDRHGRTIQTELDRSNGTITHVRTPAPSLPSGAPRPPNDYQLEYVQLSLQGGKIKPWVLKRLWSPDASQNGGQRYMHEFDYLPTYDKGGRLTKVTYPSGRVAVIAYRQYEYLNGGPGCGYNPGVPEFPDPDSCNGETGGGTCPHSWGVSQIETFLNGDTADHGPANARLTTLTQSTVVREPYYQDGSQTVSGCPTNHRGYYRYDQVHRMVDPAGNAIDLVYRTSKEAAEKNTYGLLMSETYYGGGGSGGTAYPIKRVEYVYEQLDASTDDDIDFEVVPNTITTTWLDDVDPALGNPPVPTVLTESRSDFDLFGHYQRSEFSGTAVGTERKVIIKDYANDNCPDYFPFPPNPILSNWLGDVVLREEVRTRIGPTEAGLSTVEYGVDTDRGVRTSGIRRLNVNTAQVFCSYTPVAQPFDYVTDYAFTTAGDLQSERHYVPGLASANAPTDVTTLYTYSYGALESTKQLALTYYDTFRIIDPATGLVITKRSHVTSPTDTSSGESTAFEYDALGRTTKLKYGTDDALTIAYENDTIAGSSAVRLARVRSTQGTSIAQTEAVDHFLYGRLDYEEKLNPDGTRAYRYTSYDSSDRVAFVTEWTRQSLDPGVPRTTTDYAVNDASGTKLFEDPFGRPTAVTDPLGGVTTYRYFGLNSEVTSQGVALKATALDDPAAVRTRYYTDALGRLRVVSAPEVVTPGAGHGPYEQTGAGGYYTFDVLGRMIRADVSGAVNLQPSDTDRYYAIAGSAQTRTTAFDSLGRSTQTTTPEAGTVTNLAWNALGQVTETQDALGQAWGHKHRTSYDGAGRPTRVERVVTSGTTPNNVYNAGASGWDTHGNAWRFDSPGSCLQQTGTNYPSWYVGTATCQYATSAPTGVRDLDSPVIALPHGAILTFKYFREVRDEVGLAGNHDRFSVKIEDQAALGTWTEIFFLDSSQVSWPKWVQSPALSLDAWANKSVRIRFEFDSVNMNLSPTLRGIGIGQVTVKRLPTVTLQETIYDETFSRSGNKPLGKPSTIKDFDEATGLANFTREFHYVNANARLSADLLKFDWDGDNAYHTLIDAYDYDSRGDLWRQWLPHPVGSLTRRYEYSRAHGALIGVTATDESTQIVQNLVPASTGDSIQYNDGGGMSRIRFGNGLQQHIEPNADFLPNRIWVNAIDNSASIWDSGEYYYDGTRNIKQIGQDYYRYDAAMRLTWARIDSNQQGVVDLDTSFDAFGNMTAQGVSVTGSHTSDPPFGLAFSGRSFSSNRITNSGYNYDSNGNLRDEPAHDGMSAQRYHFTTAGQLTLISPGPSDSHPGTPLQTALYEGGDHRWFLAVSADGGKAMITLRDASGQVVADYLEANASSGLTLQREYVHANGQLVAINSTCGPRPALTLSGESSSPVVVWFDKTDSVPPVGNYTIYIRTDNGQVRTITRPSNLANHFSVAQAEFFPGGVTNWIQIETDAWCGHTGYSNAVSYAYTIPGGGGGGGGDSCLDSMATNRVEFNGSGSKVKIMAVGDCSAATTYNVYYVDPNAEAFDLTPLNGSTPTSNPSQLLANIPCGSGEGDYWIRPVHPVTHLQQPSSPIVHVDGTSCGGGGETDAVATPGQPSMNAQYVHWDHLGSTRVMTDERGAPIAAFKFFAFGLAAETSGSDEVRQKFTGHERDEQAGLDYMMGRSYRMPLGRFLQPDPYDGSIVPALPQSWNRYAYVSNNPINATDPSGYAEQTVKGPCAASGTCDNPGTPTNPVGNTETEKQPDNQVIDNVALAKEYAKGFLEGAQSTLGGIVDTVIHPVDTIKGTADSIGQTIGYGVERTVTDAVTSFTNATPSEQARTIGKVVGGAVTAAATGGATKAVASNVRVSVSTVKKTGQIKHMGIAYKGKGNLIHYGNDARHGPHLGLGWGRGSSGQNAGVHIPLPGQKLP